jgi:hypothetical protein
MRSSPAGALFQKRAKVIISSVIAGIFGSVAWFSDRSFESVYFC